SVPADQTSCGTWLWHPSAEPISNSGSSPSIATGDKPLGATQPYSVRWPSIDQLRPYVRALRCLADRLSIDSIVLVPLHGGLEVNMRGQRDLASNNVRS